MDYLFNMEFPLPVKLVVAFAVVLALLALVMWIFKRIGGTRLGTPSSRGRQPRLAVIDAAAVDGRRRLVLIRRDNVEHLVMIGGPTDVLIEQNILRAVPVAPPREAPPQRAPLEGGPPLRAPMEPIPRASEPPGPPMRPQRPEPPARPPRGELPPRRAPEPPRPPMAEPPRGAPRMGPAPAHPGAPDEPSLADMAHKLEAALKRPGAREPDAALRPPPALSEPPPPTAPDLNGPLSPSPRAAAPAVAPPPAAPAAKGEAKQTSKLLDSLEEEMASLLNRPEGAPPEKK